MQARGLQAMATNEVSAELNRCDGIYDSFVPARLTPHGCKLLAAINADDCEIELTRRDRLRIASGDC